jgi:hypothetical protein
MPKEAPVFRTMPRFPYTFEAALPKPRDDRRKQTILQLLHDLEILKDGKALKIPLSELPDTNRNVCSALSRATRYRGLNVATANDEKYLYVWKTGLEQFEGMGAVGKKAAG